MGDLNRIYTTQPALYERDFDLPGFEWIDCNDREHSILAFLRRAKDGSDFVIVVCNFTPVVREGYPIGVPVGGQYREILNSDAREYGGSGVGNGGKVRAVAPGAHGRPYALSLTLPPLGVLLLRRDADE